MSRILGFSSTYLSIKLLSSCRCVSQPLQELMSGCFMRPELRSACIQVYNVGFLACFEIAGLEKTAGYRQKMRLRIRGPDHHVLD